MTEETSPQVDSAAFTVPASYASRTAWTVLSYQLAPPRGTLLIFIVLVAIAITVLASWISPVLVWVGVFMLLVAASVVFMIWLNTKRHVRAQWEVGSVLQSDFGSEAFTVRESATATTVRYDAVKSLHQWRDMVALTLHARSMPAMYPADLFPQNIRNRFETE